MSEDKKENGINRRQFLKRTAFAGTAAAVGSLISGSPASAAAKKSSIKWSKQADVVVIGAGATGLPAAIVAREAGASVILIEAEPDVGGHAMCVVGYDGDNFEIVNSWGTGWRNGGFAWLTSGRLATATDLWAVDS